MDDFDRIDVEFMMVCDGAQAVGGKLYILGGGWDRILLPSVPGHAALPFAIALGISVPWHLTNRLYQFSLELVDADGEVLEEVGSGKFEVGRPPGLRAGIAQRFPIVGVVNPEFPEAGRYVFRALIDNEKLGETVIEVVTTPAEQ